jgi:hypothetical protein
MIQTSPLAAVPSDNASDNASLGAGARLAIDTRSLVDEFSAGLWIDPAIRGSGAGQSSVVTTDNPLTPVLQSGKPWLVEQVRPLSQALESVTGDPGQISAYTQAWRNVAFAVTTEAGALRDAEDGDLGEWAGATASAYRTQAGEQHASLGALANATDGLATMSEGAGALVSHVRTMVRDMIADFVEELRTRLPQWLSTQPGSPNALIPLPAILAALAALVARFAGPILRLLQALRGSLGALRSFLRRLGDLANMIKNYLRGLGRRKPSGSEEPPPDKPAPGMPKPEPELTEDQKWQQMEDAVKKQQDEIKNQRPPRLEQPQEVFNNVRDAIGQIEGEPVVLDKGQTNNPALREQGFTERWYVEDADSIQWTVFRNPKTGKFTGAHPSGSNY